MLLRSTAAFLFLCTLTTAATAQQITAAGDKKGPMHPPEVALVDEGPRGVVYRKATSGQRLYTYDRDPPGRSTCYDGCSAAMPPVAAPADAVAVGEWTIVRRNNGRGQWALKGKPVYTMYHDDPNKPAGHGLQGVWREVPHTVVPANPQVNASR